MNHVPVGLSIQIQGIKSDRANPSRGLSIHQSFFLHIQQAFIVYYSNNDINIFKLVFAGYHLPYKNELPV